jgi:hypothetical protein
LSFVSDTTGPAGVDSTAGGAGIAVSVDVSKTGSTGLGVEVAESNDGVSVVGVVVDAVTSGTGRRSVEDDTGLSVTVDVPVFVSSGGSITSSTVVVAGLDCVLEDWLFALFCSPISSLI